MARLASIAPAIETILGPLVVRGMCVISKAFCYSFSGDYDHMLKIVVTDMAAYEAFLPTCLLQVPGIRAVNTTFVSRARKYTMLSTLE